MDHGDHPHDPISVSFNDGVIKSTMVVGLPMRRRRRRMLARVLVLVAHSNSDIHTHCHSGDRSRGPNPEVTKVQG